MSFIDKIAKVFQVLEHPTALRGLFSWKVFSLSSFRMNAALARYQPVFNTIIDVGANQGQFAIAAAHRFPMAKIYSFEPVPDIFEKLQNNVRSNRHIYAYNCAL